MKSVHSVDNIPEVQSKSPQNQIIMQIKNDIEYTGNRDDTTNNKSIIRLIGLFITIAIIGSLQLIHNSHNINIINSAITDRTLLSQQKKNIADIAHKNIITKKDLKDYNIQQIKVIGDIHGAHKTLTKFLQKDGIINQDGNWIRENMILVIIGDIIDKGDYPFKYKVDGEEYGSDLYKNLQTWQKEALSHNCLLKILKGNHDIYYEYAWNKPAPHDNSKPNIHFWILKGATSLWSVPEDVEVFLNQIPIETKEWIRQWPVFYVVDGILFSHAGVEQSFLDFYKKKKFTQNIVDYTNQQTKLFLEKPDKKEYPIGYYMASFDETIGETTPLLTRYWRHSNGEQEIDQSKCDELAQILKQFSELSGIQINKMVIGHNNDVHQVKEDCNKMLASTDVGLYIKEVTEYAPVEFVRQEAATESESKRKDRGSKGLLTYTLRNER